MWFLLFILSNLFNAILKVTFYLQLLQNIAFIVHIVQYILESILHPVVCPLPLILPTSNH